MRPHSGIRVTTLVLAAVAMTVLAWLVLRLMASGGSPVPEPGWVGAAAMLFLGGGLLLAGWQVRKVRDGSPNPAVTPLRAARTLVLGQAGALTGAVLVGWYVAQRRSSCCPTPTSSPSAAASGRSCCTPSSRCCSPSRACSCRTGAGCGRATTRTTTPTRR